jgi:hydroxymethylbilane synthase
MSRRASFRLATRGSDLATRQAAEVKAALEDRRFDVDLVEVETEGDRVTDALIQDLGKTGAFVRALDERVIEGEVDAAVHSLKDVPTDFPDDLVIAAVPRRTTPGDAFVTPEGTMLRDVPPGAVVGTASLRRRAQVLDQRPDVTVEPIRGNVDTRLEKLLAPALQAEHERRTEAEEATQSAEHRDRKAAGDENVNSRDLPTFDRDVEAWFGDLNELERAAMARQVETEYDAVVLAQAGLERTGLARSVHYERLDPRTHVPAPGQGALGITMRADSDRLQKVRNALDHARSRVEVTTERVVLQTLGGGCIAPLGIYAVLQGDVVHTSVQVYDRDGEHAVTAVRDLAVDSYADEARAFATELADQGARDLIEEAKRS